MKTRFCRCLVLLTVVLAGSVPLGMKAWADLIGPQDQDREIAVKVCALMETGHITRHKVDDTISERLHKGYLRLFDPMKMYFLQSDIDEFAAFRDQHDDHVAAGDLSLAFTVFERYLARLKDRAAWAHQLIDQNFDFNKQESIVVDPETAVYAKDDKEAHDRWEKQIKYELESRVVGGDALAKARDRLHKRYKTLVRNWTKVDNDEIVEFYLDSLTNSFDPHSTYMSPKTIEDFKIAIQNSLDGIGALLQSEDGNVTIKEVVPGGAVAKDGRLKPGDRIVGVGEGVNGEVVDVVEMKLRDVVKLIRGKAGTLVRLEVIPAGTEKRVVYQLARQKIELHENEAKGEIIQVPLTGLTGTGKQAAQKAEPAKGQIAETVSKDGKALKIGVINLKSFYADDEALRRGDADARTATNDVRKILEDFNKKGVDGVVLDLRMNGGGLLNEAITLTGLFVDDGPIVQVRDYDGKVTVYPDEIPGVAYAGPLVVLVSKFSASASEIFAGAIQDYGRGLIVGDSTTHGKGTVQKIFDLGGQFKRLFGGGNNLGSVKLTMQMFYRVTGYSTQNRGVVSDVVLPSITDNADFGESKLDYALPFSKIREAAYQPMGLVGYDVIKQLQQLSAERQKSDPELVKLAERKRRFDERRARKTLTFTEASLKKERALLSDNEKDENSEEQTELGSKKKDEKFGSDTYTKEVLTVAADLVRLRGAALTAR